jgi:hypothetical protein
LRCIFIDVDPPLPPALPRAFLLLLPFPPSVLHRRPTCPGAFFQIKRTNGAARPPGRFAGPAACRSRVRPARTPRACLDPRCLPTSARPPSLTPPCLLTWCHSTVAADDAAPVEGRQCDVDLALSRCGEARRLPFRVRIKCWLGILGTNPKPKALASGRWDDEEGLFA